MIVDNFFRVVRNGDKPHNIALLGIIADRSSLLFTQTAFKEVLMCT